MEFIKKYNIMQRYFYMDYLRVFSIFAMIVLHISTFNFNVVDVNGFDWQVFNLFNSISRWCVPVFVMISGSLFLSATPDKAPLSISKIYNKYILRMITAFVVWSVFYCFSVDYNTIHSLGDVISRIIHGHFHMWFILMIIGIYMCIPFIEQIAKNRRNVLYYLCLSFIFAFFIPTMMCFVNDFAGKSVIDTASAINTAIQTMSLNIVLGYTGYFILGHCLNNIEINKKARGIIYIMGIIGFLLTVFLNCIVAIKTQQPCEKYGGYFSVTVLLESISVFTYFKYRNYKNEKLNKLFLRLSKYCFGAYLVHAFVFIQLYLLFNLTSMAFNPLLSILSISMIVFVISFFVSGLFHKIPILLLPK